IPTLPWGVEPLHESRFTSPADNPRSTSLRATVFWLPSAVRRTVTSEPTTSPRSAASSPHLAFENVRMAFGERLVFDDLSFSFPPGRISVILGGSGSGKSTALRLSRGLLPPVGGPLFCDRPV